MGRTGTPRFTARRETAPAPWAYMPRNVLRGTGIVCLGSDANLDELTAPRGLGVRAASLFAGEWGLLMRAAVTSSGCSGFTETRLGRLWYARASHSGDSPRGYVDLFFPTCARDDSHLDIGGVSGYTGFCGEVRRRLESYRILGEDGSVLTFGNAPKSETLLYAAFRGRRAVGGREV